MRCIFLTSRSRQFLKKVTGIAKKGLIISPAGLTISPIEKVSHQKWCYLESTKSKFDFT